MINGVNMLLNMGGRRDSQVRDYTPPPKAPDDGECGSVGWRGTCWSVTGTRTEEEGVLFRRGVLSTEWMSLFGY